MVQVPDLQYQDMDSAIEMMENVGINVKVKYVESGIVEGGKVTAQSVAAGEQLAKGESITLNVENFVVDWTEADVVETAVREALGKEEGDIYASEMGNIQSLDLHLPENSKINVDALKNSSNLEELVFWGSTTSSELEGVGVETEIIGINKLSVLSKLKCLF